MTRAQLGRPVGASGEETRRRIIAATMRCVADVGYSRATIREIARTANVTSASLYNYFPNKAELIKAAIAARTDVALPRLRAAAAKPGNVIDRIEAVLDESGRLMREYPDLAAFEWVIRAAGVVGADSQPAGGAGFQAFREIIEGVIDESSRAGDLAHRPDRDSVVEAVYALIYGLVELAATSPPREYHAALESAKRMVRGTLFAPAGRGSPQAGGIKRP
ncbi:TetR/AcrR family transcriptional regulator [Mycobacterium seoulense]|uniref:TetR/AcrR family transcriptional regulator n=2 Tax=Mycobacterium seoulense TaxID=386911 RepID=UPI0013D820D5|nr:TetR/AcrR family transcriptional regulator [Mycobacterium seoulense]MCV7438539.1 TetR/AcrR family transcriptional regulator [Mycobacterium seoulense]